MKFNHIIIAFVLIFFTSTTIFASVIEIERAFMEHDYPRAELLAQEGLKRNNGGNVGIWQYYLGLSQIYLTKYGLAAAALKDLVNDFTISIDLRDKAHLALIDAYYLAEKYDQAGQIADQFIPINQNSDYLSALYLKMARIKFKQAKWTEAREHLRMVIDQFPQSLDVYLANQFLQEKMFFSIQVGSFRDHGRAKDLVSQLNAEGKTAYIFEVKDYSGQKYYRVRVGQASYLEQAENLQGELAKQGYPTRIYP